MYYLAFSLRPLLATGAQAVKTTRGLEGLPALCIKAHAVNTLGGTLGLPLRGEYVIMAWCVYRTLFTFRSPAFFKNVCCVVKRVGLKEFLKVNVGLFTVKSFSVCKCHGQILLSQA